VVGEDLPLRRDVARVAPDHGAHDAQPGQRPTAPDGRTMRKPP